MTRPINIEELLALPAGIPVADVRTPAEFAHGHIPGAVNIPLFSNEERIAVGTTYKQHGREAAILLGFDLTGPKWSGFIRQALEFAPAKRIALHCWRGGMRSAAMAWALDLYGFEVFTIRGGYKSFRRWALRQWQRPWPLSVIGGMTGSGKTRILTRLRAAGEQTIDLEDLAQHLGSAYGSLNRLVQPTQEQFENNLAAQLAGFNPRQPIWIEDESQNIGKCIIPKPFWTQIRTATLFDLQVPPEDRVAALLEEYGGLDKDFLVESTERIGRRLGPEQAKSAILAIREDRMADFIRQVLVYYDKTYRKGLSTRIAGNIIPIVTTNGDSERNAAQLLSVARNTIPI
ncbi:MAG TPA: tRNA 2-selenouridine(34) synthase MnmH [Puia sp.]|jgi:tRNA 2-selenouridine synthase|nr:tRNA 2-selenouridine(34) synthase MnmH [Puia sp.]